MIEIKNLGKQFQNETEIEYHDITFETGKILYAARRIGMWKIHSAQYDRGYSLSLKRLHRD